MGKGNGNIRSSAQGGYTPSPYEGASEEMLESMADVLRQKGHTSWFTEKQDAVWNDMSTDERELMLMQSGYTGFTDMYVGEVLLLPRDYGMKDIKDMAAEAVVNDWNGYKGTDDNDFTIVSNDGSKTYASEVSKPDGFKTTWSSSRQYAEARKALKLSKAAFIINDNYNETGYAFSSRQGKEQLKQYTGWEEWKNGRGGKRRQYIQDDWI